MKSWIFNDNDQTTELLSGQEALDYVTQHPNAYAWRPSFTHWMAVSYIEEFASVLPVPAAPKEVPADLIERFIVKEKSLVENLETLDSKIVTAINSLSEFDNEVNFYKDLTKDCNLDVQETLDNIEKQYARLKANLRTFTTTAASDKTDVSQTVDEFNSSVNNSERSTSTAGTATDVAEVTIEPDPVADNVIPEKSAINVTAERTVKAVEPVASSIGNRASSNLSELVKDETKFEPTPEATVLVNKAKPKLTPVEFTEDVTQEDLAIAAKIQAMSNAGNKGVSVETDVVEKAESQAEGDFDYLLKDKYVDDGKIGTLAAANEEELVATVDETKKRRRRRR